MSKLYIYKNYDEYIQNQIAANQKKLAYTFVEEDSIKLLCNYLPRSVKFGICHGTRRGNEQKWFKKYLGDHVNIIGTEISPTAVEFPDTICWDFHNVKDEWINCADFIYSNSFDHSPNPEYCLQQWIRCIKPETGLLILEWTRFHGPDFSDSIDPFGATLDEYQKLINQQPNCKVIDVLSRFSDKRGEIKFIIAKKSNFLSINCNRIDIK